MFCQCAYRIFFWNLRKAVMLQMDRFERVERYQVEEAQYTPHPDVRLDTSKDIVVCEFMNHAITIQMEQAEWENQPRGEARVLIPDRQADRYHIQGADAHQNGEF
jgi:hypothetical protein